MLSLFLLNNTIKDANSNLTVLKIFKENKIIIIKLSNNTLDFSFMFFIYSIKVPPKNPKDK